MAQADQIPDYSKMSLEELFAELQARTGGALPSTGQETALADSGEEGEELQEAIPMESAEPEIASAEDLKRTRLRASQTSLQNQLRRIERPTVEA